MTLYECNACKGQYTDDDDYKHTCPPVSDVDTFSPIERPDKRDENWKLDSSGERVLKSEGKGRKKVVI